MKSPESKKSKAKGPPVSDGKPSQAILTLLGGILFWPALYRVFTKLVAFVTEAGRYKGVPFFGIP